MNKKETTTEEETRNVCGPHGHLDSMPSVGINESPLGKTQKRMLPFLNKKKNRNNDKTH